MIAFSFLTECDSNKNKSSKKIRVFRKVACQRGLVGVMKHLRQ
jgi:hypothetical protein